MFISFSLRERRARETGEVRTEMIGSRLLRCNFMLTHADRNFLDDLVKRIRSETPVEINKSQLVRIAINKLRGMEVGEILGPH